MSPNRLHFLKLNTSCHFHIMSGLKIQIAIVFSFIPMLAVGEGLTSPGFGVRIKISVVFPFC